MKPESAELDEGGTHPPAIFFWALACAVPLAFVSGRPIPSNDVFYYLSSAASLAAGHGYRMLGCIRMRYPPLYPVLVACFAWLPGSLYFWATFASALFHAATCGLAYLFARNRFDRPRAAAVALLTAWSFSANQLVSEPTNQHLYAMLQMAGLLVADRVFSAGRPRPRDALLLGGIAGMGLTARSIGIALSAGLVLACLLLPLAGERDENVPGIAATLKSAVRRFRLRKRVVLSVVAGTGLALAYGALLSRLGPPPMKLPPVFWDGVGYLEELRAVDFDAGDRRPAEWHDLVERLRVNSTLYVVCIGACLVPSAAGHPLAALLLFGLVAARFVWNLLRRPSAAEWVAGCYAAVLLAFPGFGSTLYLIPVAPLIFIYAIASLDAVFSKLWSPGRRARTACTLALPMLALAAHLSADLDYAVDLHSEDYLTRLLGSTVADYMKTLAWAREGLPRRCVLLATQAPVAGYLTGRLAFSVPMVEEPDEALRIVRSLGVTHAIAARLHRFDKMFLLPLVAARPNRFHLIHSEGRCRVYRVEAAASGP